MTALDDWITDILAGRYSADQQNLRSDVDVAVAALQFIQAGIIPSGAQAANRFYGGPTTGVPAQPTFRALVAADFANTLLLSIGSINVNSATVPANGIYLAGANVPAAAANTTAIFQWSTSGLAMLAGAIAPVSTNGILGTITNNNANAGSIGEYIESVVFDTAPVSLASGVDKDMAFVSLTAGDWDVEANVISNPGAGTTTSNFACGLNTVANTLPAPEFRFQSGDAVPANGRSSGVVPRQRFSIAGATTVRIVANVTFAVSTLGVAGRITARRVR